MPEPEFTATSFYRFLGEKKLMASRCLNCGRLFLPPRPLCLACGSSRMEWAPLSGRGTVAAFTTIAVVPTAMAEAGYGRNNPYCSAVVALEEGVKISGRLVGVDANNPQAIQVGTPVVAEFPEPGEGTRPALAFRPEQ